MNKTRAIIVVSTFCIAAFAGGQRAWAGTGCGSSGTFQIDTIVGGISCNVSAVFMINNVLPDLTCAVSAVFTIDNQVEPPCTTTADCADQDTNGIRDDGCIWYDCDASTCITTDIIFADMGGAFGACPPDGFANLFDRSQALTCFAGSNPCASLNIDAGGAFGSCQPDGFCNLFDATHSLLVFAGTNTCTCPFSPAPAHEPDVVAQASLTLVADGAAARPMVDRGPASALDQRALVAAGTDVRPGQTVRVRAFMNEAMADLQAYQLHLSATGGKAGRLELVDILVELHPRAVFDPSLADYEAFNTANGQMLRGLDGGGVSTSGKAYLATFIYRVSRDASGTFVVDVLHNEAAGDQTFLVSDFTKKIEVVATKPAVISVK